MRDLNEDSSSCNWPLFYGDKTLTNGQYYNGFLPSATVDAYSGYDRDAVKQTMLDHEAIFKNQVNLCSVSILLMMWRCLLLLDLFKFLLLVVIMFLYIIGLMKFFVRHFCGFNLLMALV